ncbi:pseudouridine synthase [Microcoleus sp. EPA2]|uniref:RluA family pseudouridine synthase n=1 Tax=Microcoleus sp. EPA2 TaxID=2841654 RepID=UPI00312B6E76
MVFVHAVLDFTDANWDSIAFSSNYCYQGLCVQSGELLRLHRTVQCEAIARGLMQHLAQDESYSREGKMYGVLLVETLGGEKRVLKAFSGLLNGSSHVPGWVTPIPGRDRVALTEARTLTELESMKQELMRLQQLPQRQEYDRLFREWELKLQAVNERHKICKQKRDITRDLLCRTLAGETREIDLEELNQASRLEGIERRQLKRERDDKLQPLKQLIEAADGRITELKQQRKKLSRELQMQMHEAYTLVNFLGNSRSLQQLMPSGSIPTGTGDCCAPKLLHYAALHNLKPLAMAEFWWGPSLGDKVQGEFYGACGDRCQPLMGFLLSGYDGGTGILPVPEPRKMLPIIYEDKWLIIINKPANLLSVAGRYLENQDSVLSRCRNLLPDGLNLKAVHRLDFDTSGILILARDQDTYRKLSLQFEKKQVHKIYEAVLSGITNMNMGSIALPLWGNPENRPIQEVNWERGKPSVTEFQVIGREGNGSRIEFVPLTGRTHQLRVHAADVRGLGIPILGDRLYGCKADGIRLHLHAREISFEHPQLENRLYLKAEMPF